MNNAEPRVTIRERLLSDGYLLLAAAVSIGLGNALSRDVVHIDLVGSANAPAVVVTQNDTAAVLFRGAVNALFAGLGAGIKLKNWGRAAS